MKHACKRVSQLTSDSFDRKLSIAEKMQLKWHFAMCSLCRNYHQSLKTMADIFYHIRQKGSNENKCLSDDAKQKIQAVLDKERASK